MPEWIKCDPDVNDLILKSGDILETVTKIPSHSPICAGLKIPLIRHYGMVVFIDGQPHIVHNIIGRKPTINTFDEVFHDRNIYRVLRTGMCDEEILKRYESCKDVPYKLWAWNCESLMTQICGCSIGYPQRKGWTIGISATSIIIIILLILILFKKS